MMPPIRTTKESRLRFFDIAPILEEVRQHNGTLRGTAWIPEAAKVDRSGFYRFFDEPYIESVHLTAKSCPLLFDDGLSNFPSMNVSRSQVSFEVDEDKPNCALVVPGEGMTMLNLNADCHREIVAKELIEGFEFEPKCLVLTLAMENEQEMFNSMLASGRIMTDPFEIRVWYTVATGDHPDVKLASTNCHNGKILRENYLLDTTGQAELTALEGWRENVTKFSKLVELTERTQGYLPMGTWDEDGFFRLNPPSPPMQPGQQTIEGLIQDYKEQLVINQALVDLTVEQYSECFVADRSDETVCGLSANEAPNPWIALDGVKCRGYATLQAREEDYCGYWDSEVNPLAADFKQRKELLKIGPYCMTEAGAPAYCSPNASRTQRSGVTDVEYMIRPDRKYCEFKFARDRLTPESGFDIELCRANLSSRVFNCHLRCDTCKAECTSNTFRSLISSYRCSLGLPTLGMAAAFHSSDVGQEISRRWGADRVDGREAAPDASYEEEFRVMVQNSIDKPRAPRNAISCRKDHVETSIGDFINSLDEDGHPIQRKGFMVGCKTDLDCMSRCGVHPISGHHFACTHNVEFYTHAGYSSEAYYAMKAQSEELKAAGKPHPKVWLVDPGDDSFYLIEEPGDDRWDIQRGTGVCTDTHLDYMHTGCNSVGGSKAMMAINGCTGRAFGWATLFCGAIVEFGEDYVSDVGISASSLLYPRVLQEETKFKGEVLQRMTCSDPFDCGNKCESLERSARFGGLPAPVACALCDPPCPSNPGTSLIQTVHAFVDDVASALRLAAICINPVACVCQILMMIKPAWINELDDEIMKCSVGDIFMLLLDKIGVELLTAAETAINELPPYKTLMDVSETLADTLGKIPFVGGNFDWMKLKPLCFNYKSYKGKTLKDCREVREGYVHLHGCDPSFEDRVWKQCYYSRVDAICGAEDPDNKNAYYALFQAPTKTLQEEFQALLGDSFEESNPALQDAFEQMEAAGSNTAAQEICVKRKAKQRAMKIDEMILACLFYHIEKFCPSSSGEDNKIETFLNNVEWQLDKVVWDWTASPPPPPPASFGDYTGLISDDPAGWQLVREKLFEFWPQLDYVAMQSRGSIVGAAYSNDGQGWGGVYYVSKYSMTTAFLSTSWFKDQNSLAARMWQARYTGMFRFACRAFMAFMSDPEGAGRGANNEQPSAFENPADFTGQYDRNYLTMAAILFSESYFLETGQKWYPDGIAFWDENCIRPANEFSPIKVSTARKDPLVYGTKDFLGHEVPLTDFGPLRTYGSLRQLRDRIDGGVHAGRFPEDSVLKEFASSSNFFYHDRKHREANSIQDLYRDVVCNPTYKYTIEMAFGDPPIGSNEIDGVDGIYDYETVGSGRRLGMQNWGRDKWTGRITQHERKQRQTDLHMTEKQLGETAVRRRSYLGCGSGIASSGCQPGGGWTYEESSLWQWVYVTSSHEEDISPGWHRLLYLRAWSHKGCNENRRQVCNSYANGKSNNWDRDQAIITKFVKQKVQSYQSTLGVFLLSEKARLAAEAAKRERQRRFRNNPVATLFSAFGRRLFQLPAKKDGSGGGGGQMALNEAYEDEARKNDTEIDAEVVGEYFGDVDDLDDSDLSQWPHLNTTALWEEVSAELAAIVAAPPPKLRRQLFISSDGAYDVDEIMKMIAPPNAFRQILNSTWNMTREQIMVDLATLANQVDAVYMTPMINSRVQEDDESHAVANGVAYRTGKEALLGTRCSDTLKSYFKDDPLFKCCTAAPLGSGTYCSPTRWYANKQGCNGQFLELADSKEAKLGEEFLDRLKGASPPPSPPPSPEPPPPPSPPEPPPPPRPPVAISLAEGRAIAKKIERRFCDAVYLLSAQARCSRLASDMQLAFVLGDGFSPPSLAPRPPPAKASPPPPPRPPRPRLPALEERRVRYQSPGRVTLSTYFLGSGEDGSGTPSRAFGNGMALSNVAARTRSNAYAAINDNGLEYTQWAACTDALKDAPLPCRTGDEPARCISGARHCGTTDENTEEPWMELDLRDDVPTDQDFYFFGFELTLPNDPRLGILFFQSAQGVSNDRGDVTNRYYTVEVLDENHNPLATQCKSFHRQSIDVYSDGLTDFQFVCLEALAEDADYMAMRHVRYVRLTLRGSHRMLWLHNVRVLWRSIEALPPALPPPPDPPPLNVSAPRPPGAPPDPPSVVTGGCYAYPLLSFGTRFAKQFDEPCGLSFDECCTLSYEHNQTAAFTLTAAGCCTLLDVPDIFDINALANANLVPTEPFGFGTATTGVRDTAIGVPAFLG